MKIKSIPVLLCIFLLPALAFAQNSTENAVSIIPFWKAGETHKIRFKSDASEINQGRERKFLTVSNAKFTIKEATNDYIVVEWMYTDFKLAEGDIVTENHILAGLVSTPFIIELTGEGAFKKLLNVDEIRPKAMAVVDKLVAAKPSRSETFTLQGFAQMMLKTDQNVEILLLKPFKFYHLAHGQYYERDSVYKSKLKYPNPFGGAPFDAAAEVQMTKLDNKDSVCIIQTSKIVEADALLKATLEYIKKLPNARPEDIAEINTVSGKMEMSENTFHQILFSKGLVQKASFKRKMNLGVLNRITVTELESVQ